MAPFRSSSRFSVVFLMALSCSAGVFIGGRGVTAQNDTEFPRKEPASGSGSLDNATSLPLVVGRDLTLEKGEGKVRELLLKAKALLAQSQVGNARAEFAQALEQAPENLTALVNLGWIAQREKAWEQSEVYLRRAMKLSVEDPAIWLALGVSVLEQGKLEGATAAFTQAVALDPKNARAHRFLGLTLGRRGWLDGAEQEIRKSLETDPDDAGAHFNLAVFYLQRKPAAVELARRHYYRARDLGFDADLEIEAQLANVAKR